ncbi:MAG TPA: hypothetical protein VN632_08395 [Stellaceae bacterium]|nr:hypothetical protein [Stellaceae bacterium]
MVKKRRGKRAGITSAVLLAAMAIGLSGCGSGADPIALYRDLSGNSSADAKDKAPNSQNLTQGAKEPYPNLASVPKQPDSALTKVDRDRMAKGLIADRQNAQYTDEQLHAGQDLHAIPPPPPEPKLASSPSKQSTPKTAQAALPPSPPPAAAPPKAAPKPGPVKQEALAPPPAAASPVPQPSPSVAREPPPAPKIASTPASKNAGAKTADKKKDDTKKKKEAKVKRGAEPPPAESALRSPTLGAMPTGQDVRTPPPQPPGTPNAPSRAEARRHGEEVAAAAPPRSDVDGKRGRSLVTEIRFAPGPFRARLTSADKGRLAEIAKMVAHNSGRVRIVGYGVAAPNGDQAQREFQSFNAALDNAKAVGIELARLGVPASRIDIETARGASSSDRAEVFVEN